MQKRNGESTRSTRSGPISEQNVEQARTPAPPPDRQPGRRRESRRPWSVRRTDSPSWVEKIEEF